MSLLGEFESLDEEVKELLKNYKNKKATTYEPCTLENIKECLIGLSEEFGLLNINYIFNPYLDVVNNTLWPEALVKLINCVWTLLHYHKNTTEKAKRLVEENHKLDCQNKQLNETVTRLKEKSNMDKNESKACIASAQQISDRSEQIWKQMMETRAKLVKVTKQKESTEKCLNNEITRLKLEIEKLTDRLRNKSDSHTPCSDICDTTLLQLRERDRKQRAIISQLQANNHNLLQEIVAMKEELILGGLRDSKLEKSK